MKSTGVTGEDALRKVPEFLGSHDPSRTVRVLENWERLVTLMLPSRAPPRKTLSLCIADYPARKAINHAEIAKFAKVKVVDAGRPPPRAGYAQVESSRWKGLNVTLKAMNGMHGPK